jgi:streptogramin lyase
MNLEDKNNLRGRVFMHSKKNRAVRRLLVMSFGFTSMLCGLSSLAFGQQSGRATISGRITADQGQVIAFRVAAHNLDRRLWYTVFTNKGQYTVPQALPGQYEVMVDMRGYDSPHTFVQLAPGDTKTVDLALKKHVQSGESGAGGDEEGSARRAPGKIEYVGTREEIFPAGPGLELLKENCTGCHANGWRPTTREGFMKGIERMTETGPGYNPYVLALGRTRINKQQKELLADYLVKNFGPGSSQKRLRVDPVVFDEDLSSKAIYVSYDIPADLPIAPGGPTVGADMIDGVIAQDPSPPQGNFHHMGSTFISPVDGNIWFSSRGSSSLLRLNPTNLDAVSRWQNYPIKGEPYVHPDGIGINKQGHVFWAELKTGMLGELDPATRKQIRHALPQQVGALHEVVIDKDGNACFDLIYGAEFGRLDAITGKIHMYPTVTPDNGLYGMVVDQQGNMWAAGWQKGTINKWDAETEDVKEYKVPHSWGQIRRIGVDSKGMIWVSEFSTGILASLNPATGDLTEYKIPFNGADPYDAWPDKSDNVWMGDDAHNVVAKFDQKTKQFTYYPMPQPGQSINKFQIANNNTIWFGSRAVRIVTAVHFYPNGYTADAPPMP